ncbi:hypothetical protein OIV19_03415 [Brucella sp. HL-2]|nr:hypothetical protein [Brucella sp. HL-2]MCV9906664.1 hypothetical protein [Brucella sp. HL-2]
MDVSEKAVLPLRAVTVTSSLRAALEKQAARSGLSITELVTRYAAGVIALRESDISGVFEPGDLADNQAIAPLLVTNGRFSR